jgi:hypothetical protein
MASCRLQSKKNLAALMRHAVMVARGCKETLSADDDRKDLEKRHEAIVNALDREPVRIDPNTESHTTLRRYIIFV